MQMVRSQKKKYSQNSDNTAPKSKYFNFQEILKPNRYSSKKMNAIWGMYNENSVHNFKSMAHDGVTAAEIQAVVQGTDIVLGNQDMVQQQQIQEQLFHQEHKQLDFGKKDDMFGDLGKAVTGNFYYV